MPEISPSNTSPCQAITDLLESVALQEAGIAHIINAEGEKIQYALGLIPGLTQPASIPDLLSINDSVRKTLTSITNKEIVLQSKLQNILDLMTDD